MSLITLHFFKRKHPSGTFAQRRKDYSRKKNKKYNTRKKEKRMQDAPLRNIIFSLLLSSVAFGQPCNDHEDCIQSNQFCTITICNGSVCVTGPCQDITIGCKSYSGQCGANRRCTYTTPCCCIVANMHHQQRMEYVEQQNEIANAGYLRTQDSLGRTRRRVENIRE